jgi:hypothetical protein
VVEWAKSVPDTQDKVMPSRVPPELLGPDPEEYADFDRASRPRGPLLTPSGLISILGGMVTAFLVLAGSVVAVVLYNASQPQNLIVGSWQALDHPQISRLDFNSNGRVRVTWQGAATEDFNYYFASRSTVEIDVFLFNRDDPSLRRFRVSFDGAIMTTDDWDHQKTYRWQRVR